MEWKVGDKVHFVTRDLDVGKGLIEAILEDYTEIKEKYGSIGRPHNDMFKTKREAERESERRRNSLKDEYRKAIKTKEDLINFIFYKCGNFEEYTNHEANEVGEEKILEMFGLRLEERKNE